MLKFDFSFLILVQGCEENEGSGEGYCQFCAKDCNANNNETIKRKCEECCELKETRIEKPDIIGLYQI